MPHVDYKVHALKITPKYFDDVGKGIKPFEVRINDRDFQVGDCLHLMEWEDAQFTGRELGLMRIGYILPLEPMLGEFGEMVVMGIEPMDVLPDEVPEMDRSQARELVIRLEALREEALQGPLNEPNMALSVYKRFLIEHGHAIIRALLDQPRSGL